MVERDLINCAVAEEAKGHTIFGTVLRGKGHPHGQRNVRADDRVTAIHVIFPVEKMHRAAEAPRAAGLFPKKLSHAGVRASTARQRVSVITISGDDVVVVARSEEHTSELQSHSDLVC